MVYYILILLSPVPFIVLHLCWPGIYVLEFIAHFVSIVSGMFIFTAIGQWIQRTKSFSLPLLYMLLVLIAGIVLFHWFGWMSTLILLGAYGLLMIGDGIYGRIIMRNDSKGFVFPEVLLQIVLSAIITGVFFKYFLRNLPWYYHVCIFIGIAGMLFLYANWFYLFSKNKSEGKKKVDRGK